MPSYLVTWEIELDADDPERAARAARAVQLDPQSIATVFVVHELPRRPTGLWTIDLSPEHGAGPADARRVEIP